MAPSLAATNTADHTADGIGVFDVAQNKIVRVLKAGSDPENFDVSKDGTQLFISNEDDAAVSVVDVASGTVVKSAKVGEQPEGVKVTLDGKLVYVTSEETGTIGVLDPVAGKILKTQGGTPSALRGLHARWHKGLHQRGERWHGGCCGRGETENDRRDLTRQAWRDQANGGSAFTRCDKALCEYRPRASGIYASHSRRMARRCTRPTDLRTRFRWWTVATNTVTRKIKAGGSPWGVIALDRVL